MTETERLTVEQEPTMETKLPIINQDSPRMLPPGRQAWSPVHPSSQGLDDTYYATVV